MCAKKFKSESQNEEIVTNKLGLNWAKLSLKLGFEVRIWSWGVKMQIEIEVRRLSLTLTCEVEEKLKLKFKGDVWSWSLNLKFELNLKLNLRWRSKLILVAEEIWKWRNLILRLTTKLLVKRRILILKKFACV